MFSLIQSLTYIGSLSVWVQVFVSYFLHGAAVFCFIHSIHLRKENSFCVGELKIIIGMRLLLRRRSTFYSTLEYFIRVFDRCTTNWAFVPPNLLMQIGYTRLTYTQVHTGDDDCVLFIFKTYFAQITIRIRPTRGAVIVYSCFLWCRFLLYPITWFAALSMGQPGFSIFDSSLHKILEVEQILYFQPRDPKKCYIQIPFPRQEIYVLFLIVFLISRADIGPFFVNMISSSPFTWIDS